MSQHRKSRGPEATCAIDECETQAKIRGWCRTHYSRWRRHGDPLFTRREEISNAAAARAAKVVSDYEAGGTVSELADRYGVSVTTAWRDLVAANVAIRGVRSDDGLEEALRLPATEGACRVPICERTPTGCGLCVAHYERARRNGLIEVRPKGPNRYSSAHQKVHRSRGKATDYRCSHCDGRADTWAYDHADPAELVEATGSHAGIAFSTDPTHYMPLCRTCHYYFDRPYLEVPDVQSAS